MFTSELAERKIRPNNSFIDPVPSISSWEKSKRNRWARASTGKEPSELGRAETTKNISDAGKTGCQRAERTG